MKRRFWIDSLEKRVLLSATPTARDATFVAIANEALVVKTYYTSLTISGPAVVGGTRNWIPPTSPFENNGTYPQGTVQGTAINLPSNSQAFKIDFSPPSAGPYTLPVGSYPTAQSGTSTNPNLPTLNFSAVGLVSGASFATASFNIYDHASDDSKFAADFRLFSAADPTTPQITGIYQYGDDGVLWNDASNDSGTLSASLVSGPAHGTVSLASDGSFTYTPANGFLGTDTFQYLATDSGGGSSVATASIIVGKDAAPTFTAGPDQSVPQDDGPQSVTGWASDQAWSGVDQPGHQLRFVIAGDTNASLFSAGPAVDLTTGDLTYTTAPGATGTAAVNVVLQDDDPSDSTATVDSSPAILHITASVENQPPIALDSTFESFENNRTGGNVLSGDSDPYGYPLSAVLVGQAAHGTVTLQADGIFDYLPDSEYIGPDSFTYEATDGRVSSAPATVTTHVGPVNHAPASRRAEHHGERRRRRADRGRVGDESFRRAGKRGVPNAHVPRRRTEFVESVQRRAAGGREHGESHLHARSPRHRDRHGERGFDGQRRRGRVRI